MFDFHGSFLFRPSDIIWRRTEGNRWFSFKTWREEFPSSLASPPPQPNTPFTLIGRCFDQGGGGKRSLMPNVRRVSAILLQTLTRLPSGSWVLTPTPTPPLRRENRILWLALQTLLPMSQGSHLCVILWMQTMGWDSLSVLRLKQYTAIVSSPRNALLQCTTPQHTEE